jgi:hypothetical protein
VYRLGYGSYIFSKVYSSLFSQVPPTKLRFDVGREKIGQTVARTWDSLNLDMVRYRYATQSVNGGSTQVIIVVPLSLRTAPPLTIHLFEMPWQNESGL